MIYPMKLLSLDSKISIYLSSFSISIILIITCKINVGFGPKSLAAGQTRHSSGFLKLMLDLLFLITLHKIILN
jgi:hypothetical protein